MEHMLLIATLAVAAVIWLAATISGARHAVPDPEREVLDRAALITRYGV